MSPSNSNNYTYPSKGKGPSIRVDGPDASGKKHNSFCRESCGKKKLILQ
jgi:hypothetical protein